ncbi:MAG: response regulator transcription factor [Planctomycetes bacterium]|nr:response regulator transcription factor [Planctomycetota bacterium]
MKTRVMLVEDHTLVREGFRALLRQLPDVEVVAEAGDGRTALSLIKTHLPDVVFLDITLPGMNGLEVADRVAKKWPDMRVIMLSMHVNEEYVLHAHRAGAAGFLVKYAASDELAKALRTTATGETYFSPEVAKAVEEYSQRVEGGLTSLQRLTPRQREVLQLIAEGRTTKEISQALTISVKTVETHRMQLMERLGIDHVVGLVHYAIRTGLVATDT